VTPTPSMTALSLPLPFHVPGVPTLAREAPTRLRVDEPVSTEEQQRLRDRAVERALVERAQEGDGPAFSALVRLHQRRAYVVARAIVQRHEDAEDVVQDAFLQAYRALGRFRPEQPFGAWLSRIVANAALDLVRRRKVRDADILPESLALPFRDPAEADELRTRLRVAIAALPDRQRAVIVLHDVEGYTHGEIGGALGIPEGTARSDLHHARVAMRRALGITRNDP